jgi:hypothetical protein
LDAVARGMKAGARDGQHGVGQRSTRGIKVRRAWARGSEESAWGSDGHTPDSVGDRLIGLGDGPMGPSP